MSKVKLIILIGLVSFIFLPNAYAYADAEGIWIEAIINTSESEPVTNEINEGHIKEADIYILQGSINPVVWYLRGAFGAGKHGFYYSNLLESGKPYILGAPESQTLIKEYQSYYQKALNLDERPDAHNHLTGDMLSNIGSDTVGYPEIRARALKKAGELARSGQFTSGNEWFEGDTYEARLDIYIDAKDYDNYLKTVNEMIERFGSSEELEGIKLKANALIAQRDRERKSAK